ncbi:acetylornithine transaminase [Actinosynnema pretiosum subsp. pretiosum]|uniref:Acetylornithine aminotransferase n=3 Tax=Actinosynnema TaxID=40566 RepID=C6WA83_ACTMD|nr:MULTISPECIES: acetylornithine transaminase [Actinosynnema]ACU39272.1 acetylornithine and succinylornithine aminotransferase [Actinosynnema mirum DSM 43827]ATE56502.1 aspartate aminotransferase family protein [Actinosynnema pretiosum]AXX32871.1 Acetylornithine aminotransferase [Actinosynnema pretiosum subsp. pretiosum]QUF03260.1 acetylornithine transaminase [Actinosynnema pretiosum subsp. pretiosum]
MSDQQRWQAVMMDNYGTPALALERGEGAFVWDVDGNRYLDLVSGIAVNALGHAHPAVVAAVTEQIGKLGHTSNLYINHPSLALAERLLDLAGVDGDGRVLFCNSGAEANEAALKLSRRTGRTKVVATTGGFHGRTMGALALTGQPGKRTPFEPLVPGVEHVPFGDVAALEAAIDDSTAAFFVEPVQGENGVVVPPEGYLQAARRITAEHGALLVVDEVQTGVGRLGSWFAFHQAGIVPDVVTLAKGLGGGLPLGACIAIGPAKDLFQPGQHGTTFGGNPVCCAAALAVLDTIAADGLLEHASSVGKEIAAGVEALNHPLVAGVRGAGLLLGVLLREPVSAAVAAAAKRAGYLVNPVQPDVIRLAPPLVLDEVDAHRLVADLPSCLES